MGFHTIVSSIFISFQFRFRFIANEKQIDIMLVYVVIWKLHNIYSIMVRDEDLIDDVK